MSQGHTKTKRLFSLLSYIHGCRGITLKCNIVSGLTRTELCLTQPKTSGAKYSCHFSSACSNATKTALGSTNWTSLIRVSTPQASWNLSFQHEEWVSEKQLCLKKKPSDSNLPYASQNPLLKQSTHTVRTLAPVFFSLRSTLRL